MTESRKWMVQAMKVYGGEFVKALGRCYEVADESNSDKLDQAFPSYVQTYTMRGDAMRQLTSQAGV